MLTEALPGLEGHTAVAIGDSIVAYGGKTSPRTLNPFTYALDLTTNQWQRLSCGGIDVPPRCFHSAVAHGWNVYVFGGLLAIGIDDIHYNKYNVFANVDALPPEVIQRHGRDRLLGGPPRKVTQQKKEATSLYCLNLEGEARWDVVAATGYVPPTRANHCAVVYKSSMYVYGGYSVHTTGRDTDEELKAVYTMYALHLPTLTWSVVETHDSIPPQIWGFGHVLASDVLLLFGGVDIPTQAEENAICAWHMERKEWRWLSFNAAAPPKRAMHTCIRWGHQLVCFGGAGEVNSVLYNDVFVFDMVSGAWSSVRTSGEPPLPRAGHTATVVGEKVYIFGGMDHSFHRSPRCWSLHLGTWVWETVSTLYSIRKLDNIRGLRSNEPQPPAPSPADRPQRRETAAGGDSPVNPDFSRFLNPQRAAATRQSSVPFEVLPVPQEHRHPLAPPTARSSAYDPTLPTHRIPTRQATSQYPVLWTEEDDGMRELRSDIVKSRTVLDHMLDSAGADARRTADGIMPLDEALPMRPDASPTRADEARDHLHQELESRRQRLTDLTTSDDTVKSNVQQYWERELDQLSQQNEAWRRATERENAAMHLYEQRASTNRRPVAGMLGESTTNAETSTLSMAMFPYSSGSTNRVHDPEHPQFQKTTFRPPPKQQYVSPSIKKLGLSSYLGNTRTKEQFELSIPGGLMPSEVARNTLGSPSPPKATQRPGEPSSMSTSSGPAQPYRPLAFASSPSAEAAERKYGNAAHEGFSAPANRNGAGASPPRFDELPGQTTGYVSSPIRYPTEGQVPSATQRTLFMSSAGNHVPPNIPTTSYS